MVVGAPARGFDYTPLQRNNIDDLIFYGALGAVLGGRIGYVLLYNFDKFLADPVWLFKVWEGGMSFHGGFLGVLIAMIFYARRLHLRAGQMLDFVAPIVPLGLAFGRIGNFIGQELWGRQADPAVVPWAMIFLPTGNKASVAVISSGSGGLVIIFSGL